MSREVATWTYIGAVLLAAAGLATGTTFIWSLDSTAAGLWLYPVLAILVAVAGRFPVELSRQAQASLFTVPIFTAVLLGHPALAVAVAAAGTLVSQALLGLPYRAIAFNVGVAGMAAAAGGIVFLSLTPEGSVISLTANSVSAGVAAGAVLHAVNVLGISAMVTVRKGHGFWKIWAQPYALEAVQEGAMLALGLLAAVLIVQVWWGLLLIGIPTVIAYFALKRSMREAQLKAELAEELRERILELKGMHTQLVQSAKMASVGTLAAGVAHEINNPVFAIAGRAEMMLRNADRHLKSEKAVEHTETILEMAGRISTIVRRLLEHARPSDEVEVVDLSEVMEESLSLMGAKIRSRKVAVFRDYATISPTAAVPSQLQQVLVNLVANALDVTADGGSVVVGCRQAGKTVAAYVKDYGEGIDDDIMDRLFEPFFTTKEVGKGTGLGLFICHKIVSSHNGEISVDSKKGEGTTFWMRLPTADAVQRQDDVPAQAVHGGTGPG